MTDAAYKAKTWLLRTEDLEEERKKATNRLLLIESKINNCIVSYEGIGGRDLISSQARREDLLIEYSSARAELESVLHKLDYEDFITLKAIERLNSKYCAILAARYIRRASTAQLSKENFLNYEKSQLYKFERRALDALGQLLENEQELQIIPNEQRQNMPA